MMKVEFDKSFEKSLKKLVKKDRSMQSEVKDIVRGIISRIQKSNSIHDLPSSGVDILELKISVKNAKFRIKKGRYRIGAKVEGDTVIFLWITKRDEGTYR